MQQHLYLLVPLSACVASSMLLAVFLAGRIEHRANRVAALLVSGAIVWSFCEVLWNTADDPGRALGLVRLSSLGWVAIGPLGLQVLAAVTGTDSPRLRATLPWLYGLSGAFFVIDVATPWLHPGVVERSWGWSYELGPAYPAFYLFTIGCLGFGLTSALRALRGLSPAERSQTRVLVVGLAVPMVVASATDGLLPWLGFHPPRFGTASFAFLGASIAWSFHRYGHSLLAPRAFALEILETLGDGVALLHPDGRIRRANGALARLLAREPGEIEDRRAADLLPGAPLEGAPVDDHEMEIATSEGTLPVAISTAELHDKRELPLGRIVVVRDLREVVSLRRRLLTAGRLRAVGGLAAGIAHEINNPAAYVRTNLSVLRQQLDALDAAGAGARAKVDLDDSRELVDESMEGVDRIAGIVRDLRGFAGGGDDAREAVDLNALLEPLLRVLAPHFHGRARVETVLRDVPCISGSPQELKQVLTDILLNAGVGVEGEGTIRIVTGVEGDAVVVAVEDDGPGIEPEAMERIFDPFYRSGPEDEGGGHSLAVAWQLVQQHGGRIEVDSEPGAGTTVTVRLPAL